MKKSTKKKQPQTRPQQWHKLDPYYSREQKKYDHPIPSREYIVQFLNESGKTLSWRALAATWKLDDQQADALERRLKAMERNGELIRNRRQGYGVVTELELIKGRVIGHAEGYGFVQPDDGSDDIYISPRQMRQILHGDRVVVRLSGIDRRGDVKVQL